MDLYSKCWRLEAARKVFDGLRLSALGFRNPVNTMMLIPFFDTCQWKIIFMKGRWSI